MTFSSNSWRSLNPLKGSLNHPKKVTKNCQESMGEKHHNFMERLMFHTHIMFSHLDRQLSVIQSVPKNQTFQKKTKEHVDIE